VRVLYLTNNANRSSTNVSVEGWFRSLLPRGLQPVFVSSKAGPFHAAAREAGIPTYQCPLPFPVKWYPLPFLRVLWTLRKVARRHGAQIIHCNVQEVYPVGQYLGRLCRLPVVLSIRSRLPRGFSTWALAGRRQPQRLFFNSHNSLETCAPAVDGLVPQSRWKVLYNGLDLEQYKPDPGLGEAFRRQHGLGNELVIGMASALRPGKQLEHLFEAAASLSVPAVRVLLAGREIPGEEDYARNALQVGKRLLGDRFTFVGWLEDPRGLFNALDLCINPSKEESFGVSVLQALACGCPVVGYPSVAVQEVVLPGGGEIVPQDHIAKLRDAIDEWLGGKARSRAVRQGARQRAEFFDIRRSAALLWDEYEKVLQETRAAS
jgi:glycosyltransferase involved in cell wall biosynthesis